MVLLRNSARDTKKGDKLVQHWLRPYKTSEKVHMCSEILHLAKL